ncbi:HupE/UreJ family protein [Maribacter sp. 2307UL18-2]|uniref:HupE/UreJ family protein n=1 Tax=Maribacter sp. 2307UL18-2 TaxID=3386274 RepID=UPI0039BC5A01
MENFWFYIQLGLSHVLDFAAYDHILFLAALAVPFTFEAWRRVLLLVTVFTITHCLSLYLSVYEIVTVDVGLIEFLIPVTILGTALFNLNYGRGGTFDRNVSLHLLATAFFGLIHGFGFSNYFKMLMAEEENKLGPLLGFATGIEIAQVLIVLAILAISYLLVAVLGLKKSLFVLISSILIILITIPILIRTFPW